MNTLASRRNAAIALAAAIPAVTMGRAARRTTRLPARRLRINNRAFVNDQAADWENQSAALLLSRTPKRKRVARATRPSRRATGPTKRPPVPPRKGGTISFTDSLSHPASVFVCFVDFVVNQLRSSGLTGLEFSGAHW